MIATITMVRITGAGHVNGDISVIRKSRDGQETAKKEQQAEKAKKHALHQNHPLNGDSYIIHGYIK